jgi:hypothetical protein
LSIRDLVGTCLAGNRFRFRHQVQVGIAQVLLVFSQALPIRDLVRVRRHPGTGISADFALRRGNRNVGTQGGRFCRQTSGE